MKSSLGAGFACFAVICWFSWTRPSLSDEKPLAKVVATENDFLEVGQNYTFLFGSGQRHDNIKVVQKLAEGWIKGEAGPANDKSTCWINLKFVESIYLAKSRPAQSIPLDSNR